MLTDQIKLDKFTLLRYTLPACVHIFRTFSCTLYQKDKSNKKSIYFLYSHTFWCVVQGAVIDQCQKMKYTVRAFNFTVASICRQTIQRSCYKVLFCEINYILDFMLSIGTHEYAFSSTKGKNLNPILLPLFKTNQRVATSNLAGNKTL